MPDALPSARTLALFALLVVGLGCSFAFHAAMVDMRVTYTATAVGPGTDPHLVARSSPQVADLDARLRGHDEAVGRPVRRAARTGSFEGNVAPDAYTVVDGLDAPYVVYDGSYYRWNESVDPETTFVSLRMRPTDAASVLDAVAAPYERAPPEAKRAVENGSTSAWGVEPGVYRRDGTVYAVRPSGDAPAASKLFAAFLGYLLTPVGRGYVAVALGILAYRWRNPLADRVLTPRRAAAAACLAVPVSLVGTLVFERGTLARLVTHPASALAVAAGVVAGVLAHQRRWAALVGVTVLVAAVTTGADALVHGVFGLVLGAGSFVVGFVAGVVPFAYGVAFGRARPATGGRDALE